MILMVKPDQILVQEIKVLPAKSKMTDLVALRHSWSPNHEAKTTLILLCEDGSLRIYNANPQTTGLFDAQIICIVFTFYISIHNYINRYYFLFMAKESMD